MDECMRTQSMCASLVWTQQKYVLLKTGTAESPTANLDYRQTELVGEAVCVKTVELYS